MRNNTIAKEYRVPRTPLYKKIEADLRAKVREGRWLPGAMLPSRKALAQEYNVDLRTLQEAIVHLLADGTLRADSRRGTYVSRAINAILDSSERYDATAQPESYENDINGNFPGAQSQQVSRARRARTDATLGIVAVSWPEEHEFIDLSHPQSHWAHIVISSLEQVFSDAGGATLFVKRHDHGRNVHFLIGEAAGQMLARGAKAIAFINVVNGSSDIDEIAAFIDHERVPAVVLAWQEIIGTVSHVINDDVNGGYQASMHLLTGGYTPRIMIDPYQTLWSRQRLLGAREAVAHAGFTAKTLQVNPNSGIPDGARVAAEDRDEQAAYRLAQQAFAHGFAPGAGIIAANDTAAYGILRAAEEIGLKAGRDYGLVGFDDLTNSTTLGLTSLRPAVEDMGQEAGRMLLRALEGQKIPHQVRHSPKLIARASTMG